MVACDSRAFFYLWKRRIDKFGDLGCALLFGSQRRLLVGNVHRGHKNANEVRMVTDACFLEHQLSDPFLVPELLLIPCGFRTGHYLLSDFLFLLVGQAVLPTASLRNHKASVASLPGRVPLTNISTRDAYPSRHLSNREVSRLKQIRGFGTPARLELVHRLIEST